MTETVDETVNLSMGSLQSQASCPERYEIKSLIGHGGMGFVFYAIDKSLLREVAIKVLVLEGSRDPDSQQRFLREAQVLALLVHPNIVRIYSSDINAQGNPYHVMEYLEGESLSRVLAGGALDAGRFFSLFKQVLAGLEYAHKQGIVHRDLKPSNIMRCVDAEGAELYKIIDFGIARMDMNANSVTSSLTRTDAVMGSPRYISPEQCRGERGDYLSDVYSIGCMLHECISGKPLFEGETAFETMYKQMTETPRRLDSETMSEASKRLGLLIDRCLQKNPAQRPQTAAEIAMELEEISCLGLANLDIFSKQSSVSKNLTGRSLAITCAALASLTVLVLLASLYQSSMSSASLAGIIKSGNFKTEHEISKLKVLIASCKDPSTIKVTAFQQRYLNWLLALGCAQTRSSDKQDRRDADKSFSDALKFCSNIGGDFDVYNRASCYAFRAKSKFAQGLFADSESDFAMALSLLEKPGSNKKIEIDILYDRAALRIKERNFADARMDIITASQSYDATPLTLGTIEQKIMNQLDRNSVYSRSDALLNLQKDLSKMEANSSEEAVQMVLLSNYLADRMSRCKLRSGAEVRNAFKYSASLLSKIEGEEQLKKKTLALLAAS